MCVRASWHGLWGLGGASWCRAAPNQCRLPREAPPPAPWEASADCCGLANPHGAPVTYHLPLFSPEMHLLQGLSGHRIYKMAPASQRVPGDSVRETKSPAEVTPWAWIGHRGCRVMPATAAFWVRAGGGGRVPALHDGRDDNQYWSDALPAVPPPLRSRPPHDHQRRPHTPATTHPIAQTCSLETT